MQTRSVKPILAGMNQRCIAAMAGLLLCSASAFAQDCPDGQLPISIHLHTDAWGMNCTGSSRPLGDSCGVNTLAWGGNALNVGCDGEGIDGADEGYYASNSSFIVDSVCITPGDSITLHHVDSYGDGGTFFEVYGNGVLTPAFPVRGSATYGVSTPWPCRARPMSSPCGAAAIEVDGPVVLVSNDSCTAAYAEPVRQFRGSIPAKSMGVVRNRRHRIRVVDLHGGRGELLGHSLYRFHGLRHADRLVEGRRLWRLEHHTLVAANDDLPGAAALERTTPAACGRGASRKARLTSFKWTAGRTPGDRPESSSRAHWRAQVTSSQGGLNCALGKEEDRTEPSCSM